MASGRSDALDADVGAVADRAECAANGWICDTLVSTRDRPFDDSTPVLSSHLHPQFSLTHLKWCSRYLERRASMPFEAAAAAAGDADASPSTPHLRLVRTRLDFCRGCAAGLEQKTWLFPISPPDCQKACLYRSLRRKLPVPQYHRLSNPPRPNSIPQMGT